MQVHNHGCHGSMAKSAHRRWLPRNSLPHFQHTGGLQIADSAAWYMSSLHIPHMQQRTENMVLQIAAASYFCRWLHPFLNNCRSWQYYQNFSVPVSSPQKKSWPGLPFLLPDILKCRLRSPGNHKGIPAYDKNTHCCDLQDLLQVSLQRFLERFFSPPLSTGQDESLHGDSLLHSGCTGCMLRRSTLEHSWPHPFLRMPTSRFPKCRQVRHVF